MDNEKLYYARNHRLSFKLYGLHISTNKMPVIDLFVKGAYMAGPETDI